LTAKLQRSIIHIKLTESESHKQKNRKQNMADPKIKPQHHPAGRSFKFPLLVRIFVPLCLSGQDPRSTLVEPPLQIALFFAKQSQFAQSQNDPKPLSLRALWKSLPPPTPRKTNPIKPNFKRSKPISNAVQSCEISHPTALHHCISAIRKGIPL